MNSELKKDTKFKFSNYETIPESSVNFRNEDISRQALEEVFALDNFFYESIVGSNPNFRGMTSCTKMCSSDIPN
jgi:hypothetical protein